MHISDGVLSTPVAVGTTAITAATIAYSVKGMTEEEIPKTSLMAGAFFAVSLISIPVGPSTIHPLFSGLLGVMLGRRAPLAIFVGLLLQAVLFQHGGLTTLGANTMMLSIPALISHKIFCRMTDKSVFLRGALVGALSVTITVGLLIVLLFLTDPRFGEGFMSVINILIVGHIPLVLIEALVTASALQLIQKAKPAMLVTE
ncbi:cobalt/nickel transport system permease protein [Tindallia californiensis]|uniref:Cobalt/nickel transport system permease protein n=3 Tax=Tindalliaceae TaxID=3118658 RepID=A0A1H3P6F5_9FIRM|nr:cobalt/nickel transport system permease protein [Tindallia californiensis]SFH84576.1 cobalt/nickel transport system permease protein [Tindallia magadiensis]